MTDCCRSAGNGLHLDARKRVNYSLGLVLGEEEFRQDQLHLRERDQLANRALHGYGTISGLEVTVDGAQVTVAPGLALDAAGRFVCVSSAQCADLDRWLEKHEDEVIAQLGSPPQLPASISLHLLLCYLECETDKVPLPLEPCQTGEDSMVASRVSESFELRFSLQEAAPVGELATGAMEDAVDDLVAAAQPQEASPPESPPFTSATTEDSLHDWAVLGRPGAEGTACLDAPAETCVPLGRVLVPVDVSDDGAITQSGDAEVDDAGRPVLVSTRFLQEWLTQLTASEKIEPQTLSLDDLTDVDTSGTDEGDVLTFENGEWVPAPAPASDMGTVTAHGKLSDLDVDDHPLYLPVDGTRALTGPLNAGGNRLVKLADGVDDQDAVTVAQIAGVMKNGDVASGDLSGKYPAPLVARLMKRPLANTAPKKGDALVWNGEFWTPTAVTAGEPVPVPQQPQLILPLATITRLDVPPEEGAHYEIWFNLDAPGNDVEIEEIPEEGLLVRTEIRSPALRSIAHKVESRPGRNVFVVTIEKEPTNGLLRFVFLPEALVLTTGATLAEDAKRRGVVFEGQDPEGTVTKFVRDPQTRAIG